MEKEEPNRGSQPSTFSQKIFESLHFGLMLFNKDDKLQYMNELSNQICSAITKENDFFSKATS